MLKLLLKKNTISKSKITCNTKFTFRTGFISLYVNCPIHWAIRLQTDITLSTAEAEYKALLSVLHEVILLMTLLMELHLKFPVYTNKTTT